jgi:hypothetical protein
MSQTISDDSVDMERIDSELADEESTPIRFEIATYPADFTLEVLYQKWLNKDFAIPPFQRKFVWKKAQSSRLIESFMMGLPVPQIFLYVDENEKLLIVDGHQRLKSVFYFFEGYWGEPDPRGQRKIFKLNEINEKSKWFSKSFEEFEASDKRRLKNALLRAVLVKQLDPTDDTSVYHVFERLNTGGTLLQVQEVRNCVYWGALNDVLSQLNLHPQWRNIVGKPLPDIHLKDVELILRFLALYHWLDEYESPMKDFLSKFMKRHRNPKEEFLSEERKRFENTCEVVLATLGQRPFNPRGPLNAAVFDCVFVAFSKHGTDHPRDIAERYHRLLQHDGFRALTTSATTNTETVRKRMEMAERALFH